MLIRPAELEAIRRGEIDLAFRRWDRPRDKVGTRLRTAVGVGSNGWAQFDYVRMPEYKWGILLAPRVTERKIPFGANKGEPAWQEVPGEHRAMLRRLIVIQGDTEPASVEQQRYLGKTAPSLNPPYALRERGRYRVLGDV